MQRNIWLAAALAFVLALTPLLASADSVGFTATTQLQVVGALQFIDPGTATPMDTVSEFEMDGTGNIREVAIQTTNEFVAGLPPGMAGSCGPDNQGFCDALAGAMMTSLHDSDVVLEDVLVVPGSGAFAGKNVLIGDFGASSKLQGEAAIIGSSPGDGMAGEFEAKIQRHPALPPEVPTAVYGCIASLVPLVPLPLDISSCQEGSGRLVPLALYIRDEGEIEIEELWGAFGQFDEFEGRLVVEVLGDTGIATIVGKLDEDGD